MVLDRIMPLCGDGHFNHQTCVFMNVCNMCLVSISNYYLSCHKWMPRMCVKIEA